MNEDFISSSMDTGMRSPAEDCGPDGGGGGAVGGGVWPSMVSMRWARNLSRSGVQVTTRALTDGHSTRLRFAHATENAHERIYCFSHGVLHYICDRNSRLSSLGCKNGHPKSAESAYISVQKLDESASKTAPRHFFTCAFLGWSQNVPAAAMRLHCGTTLGFDGG